MQHQYLNGRLRRPARFPCSGSATSVLEESSSAWPSTSFRAPLLYKRQHHDIHATWALCIDTREGGFGRPSSDFRGVVFQGAPSLYRALAFHVPSSCTLLHASLTDAHVGRWLNTGSAWVPAPPQTLQLSLSMPAHIQQRSMGIKLLQEGCCV